MDNKSIEKSIVTNRKARYNYEIIDSLETGIVLIGSEVKSIRKGKVSLADSYAKIKSGEIWVVGIHISQYEQTTFQTLDPIRERKLLLHRLEIKRLARKVQEKSFTLIPLRLYFKNNRVKLELGIARGKRQYDKKIDIARKDAERDIQREQKKFRFKL